MARTEHDARADAGRSPRAPLPAPGPASVTAPGPASATAPARATRFRLARAALAWAVGIALLAWMTRDVEWRNLTAPVANVPAWAWVTTVLGLLCSYLLRALRIHAELRTRRPLTVAQCLEVMLIHNSAVNVLPMRGGEAAYPWLVNRRLGIPLDQAAASLVWMRVQDAFVLALFVLAFWPGIPTGGRLVAAAVLAVALAVGLHTLQRTAARFTAPPRTRLLRAAHRAVQALALAPRHGWIGWAYCASSWTVKLFAFAVLLQQLSGLPLPAAATGALGGELAGVLPVQGPANLGTYEAGVYMGAALRGGAALGAVVTSALVVHLLALATAVVSGAVAYTGSRGRAGVVDAARGRP